MRTTAVDEYQLTTNSPDRPAKRWGWITALPSEYLLHFRSGRILDASSGQAATCFKRLRDTVFVIPTSLKEIVFEANQLTADDVDVRIRGMAVYRIADPLKIYRLINFSSRHRAEAKLARMIADMCRSRIKWLVANMRVEECIRKRKEEIAEALKAELSHVVTQENGGWGLEIITIDIQDVYIQDAEIFEALQMRFKAEKMRQSRLAEMEMERDLTTRTLAVEQEMAEHRKDNSLHQARIEAEIRQAEIRLAQESDREQFELDRFRVEENESIARYKQEQALEAERRQLALEVERTRQEIEARRLAREEELAGLGARVEIENRTTPVGLERRFVEEALPAIARSLAESMGDVRWNVYNHGDGGASPFRFAVDEVTQTLLDAVERFRRGSLQQE